MRKLLILQNELSAYNVPTYNKIAEKFDLTIGYYRKDDSRQECHFAKKCFAIKHVGPFTIVKGLLKYAKTYDLVCIVPDMHVVSYCLLPFLPRKYKVVNWSIGFRVSYEHPFITDRKHVLADKVFQGIISRCDASIFYTGRAKEFWKGTKLNLNKVFVAPNTTEVFPCKVDNTNKTIFLFVGTLYKGKGLNLLLNAYKEAIEFAGVNNELHIVGDGEERTRIEKFIKENRLEGKVKMHGAVFDEQILAHYFSKALLCISPNQAGLSVPKSMGYGVTFVTKTTAITGGEMYHISPGVNGIFYKDDRELTNILIDASEHPELFIEMGMKAKEYYDNYATIDHMANGAMSAFEYALKN